MTTQHEDIGIKFRLWILTGLTLLLSMFMTFLNLSEFINVAVLNKTTDYPFGAEGPVPWYYESSGLYAKVTLVSGLAFLSAFILAIWAGLRKSKKGIVIVLLSTILLIVLLFINGQTGD